MCRTVTSVLSSAICATQMLVRVFMTIILMLENLIRLILQTFYNLISFILQLISLLPICVVFLVTSRLKCFMCGGGGPCPVNRGGGCDCLMSFIAIVILFFIFRATGILDKIFYSMGYAKAPTSIARFIPTPGDVTECSRNDTEITEYELDYITETATSQLFTDDDNDRPSESDAKGGDDAKPSIGGGDDAKSPDDYTKPPDVNDDNANRPDVDANNQNPPARGRESPDVDANYQNPPARGPDSPDIDANDQNPPTEGPDRTTPHSKQRFVLVDDDNFDKFSATVIEESVLDDMGVTPMLSRKRRTPNFKNIVNDIMVYLN